MEGLDFVMLVDDDEINNFICANIILKSGFAKNLKSFTDPEEAFNYLISGISNNDAKPQMMFLDINMPIIDGWAFLDKIESEGDESLKRLPIIMLSSSIYQDDVQKSKSYRNVVNFVSKPINKEILELNLEKIRML